MTEKQIQEIIAYIKTKGSCTWIECRNDLGLNEVFREAVLSEIEATGHFKIIRNKISLGREAIRIKVI